MYRNARMMMATALVLGTAQFAVAQGGGLKTVPNSVKYKNSGAKPATGRSGSATLEGRVLIAKDQTMKLEASTAGVEAAAHPGTITKMQVKIGPDFTQNHNGLNAGGYWSFTMPAAPRGQAVQLQANIKGIDPKRNDVVTVSTPALRRPDVAVTSVAGPQKQAPLTPVTFFATVKELNGDIGATASCVLSVNGTAVQTIPGMWVDANGTVSCQFNHSFAEPGTYQIGASATGVNPGDWDTANNSAATTIEIVNPNTIIANGYLQAYQSQHDYLYEWKRSRGAYCDYYYYSYACGEEYRRVDKGHQSNLYMHGWSNGAAAIDYNVAVNARISTNGVLTDQVTLGTTYVWDYYWYYGQRCAQNYGSYYWDGNRYHYPGVYFEMCSQSYDGVNGTTWYYYQRLEGDVTYQARRKYCYQDGSCYEYDDYYYYWNNYRYGAGDNWNWKAGDAVRLEIAFTDGAGRQHTADRSVTLSENYNNQWQNGPYTWFDYWWGDYYQFERYSHQQYYGWTNWNDGQ